MNIHVISLEDLTRASAENQNNPAYMRQAIKELGASALPYIGASLQDNPDFILEILSIVGSQGLEIASASLKQSSEFMEKTVEILGISACDAVPDHIKKQWEQTAHNIIRFTEASLIHEHRELSLNDFSPEEIYEELVSSFQQHCDDLELCYAAGAEYEATEQALEQLVENHSLKATYSAFKKHLEDTQPDELVRESLIKKAIVTILLWKQELSPDGFLWINEQNLLCLLFQNLPDQYYFPSLVVLTSQIAKTPHLQKNFEEIQLQDPAWQLLKIPMTCIRGSQIDSPCDPLIAKLNAHNLSSSSETLPLVKGLIELYTQYAFSYEEKAQIIQDLAKGDPFLNAKTLLNIFHLDMAIELQKLLEEGTQDIFKVLLENRYQVQILANLQKALEDSYPLRILLIKLKQSLVQAGFSKEACSSFENSLRKMENPEARRVAIIDALIALKSWKTELSPQEFDWLKQQNLFALICQDFSLRYERFSLIVLTSQIARSPQLRDRFENITLKHAALQSLKIPLTFLDDLVLMPLIETLNKPSLRRASTPDRLSILYALMDIHFSPSFLPAEKILLVNYLASDNIISEARDLHLAFTTGLSQEVKELLKSSEQIQNGIMNRLYNILSTHFRQAFTSIALEKNWDTFQREILKKYRIPHALEIYFAKIQLLKNPEVLSCFIKHLESLADNTYLSKRYSTDLNPHLKHMHQETLQAWQINRSELLADGYTIDETDDPQDIFLCGSDLPQSCLTYNGKPQLIQGLLGYLVHGQTRLIAVKNPEGKIVSRAILRLLLNEQNQPVLFLEPIYATKKGFEDAIYQIAKQKAAELKCDLTEYDDQGSYTSSLQSLGGPAPVEQVDAAQGGCAHGVFTLPKDCLTRIN